MDLAAFRASLDNPTPPPGLGLALQPFGAPARETGTVRTTSPNATNAARAIGCTPISTARRANLANAGYWYRRAGKPVARGSLDEEWRQIVAALL